jgi:predicted ATP-grasp superfamily ATP-dependent carboligase
MEPVIVLDANQRSALAATRALGRRGVRVITADTTRETLAGASRYASGSFVYPSPYRAPGEFVERLATELAARAARIVLPMTEVTTHVLARDGAQLPGVSVPVGTFEALETLTDKRALQALAKQLDIPAPETRIVECPEQVRIATAGLAYPLVVKPYRSRIWTGDRWRGAEVRYVSSPGELDSLTRSVDVFRMHPFLVQEYIDGHGAGVFALYDRGRASVFFAHRRLRERPPSGGVSVLSESVSVDPHMRELSQRLLDHVEWHGPAMVEFKVCRDGRPYLMEVNPRFWGSLQLPIDAGVDFPWLAYQLARGQRLDVVTDYRIGARNRWLLGDLDCLYLSLKTRDSLRAKCRAVAAFVGGFGRGITHEIERRDDMWPCVVELKRYVSTAQRADNL